MKRFRSILIPALLMAVGLALVILSARSAGTGQTASLEFRSGPVLGLLKALSDDAMEGRATGSAGNEQARMLIRDRMESLGLEPVGDGWFHPFRYGRLDSPAEAKAGVNVIGTLRGREAGGPVMVVSAHYDHLGVRDGAIYNGADDNASGVAAMLALAQVWSKPNTRPRHDVLFVAFDAEEDGFGGSLAFLQDPPVDRRRIAFNLNLDMVSKSEKRELYVVGTYHHPELLPLVQAVAAKAPVRLLIGHDRPEDGPQDWTLLSDHAVFYRAGIAFLYVGVEDHEEYHTPEDDFNAVPQDFFLDAVRTIILLADAIDRDMTGLVTGP